MRGCMAFALVAAAARGFALRGPGARAPLRRLAAATAAADAGVAAQVEAQGALIRDLKEGRGLGNKSPEVVAAVAELVRLKALLEPPPDAGGDATEAYAELRGRRLAKAEAMRAAGVEPFAYGFEASHSAAAAQAAQGSVGDVVAARADADRLNLELAKTLSSTTRSGVLRAR